MAQGRKWTKESNGGKCELKGNKAHHSSALSHKGETLERLKGDKYFKCRS